MEISGTDVLSDDDLLMLAQEGLQHACIALCERHRRMAYGVVYRILKNHEDTEDALQDAFIKVVQHIRGFGERAAFSTWLMRICINTALMTLRKRKAHPTYLLSELGEPDARYVLEKADRAPSAESRLLEDDQTARLRRAIRRLPRGLRVVMEIRCSEHVQVDEVAAMAGLSLAATKSRLLRGKNQLASMMNPMLATRRPASGVARRGRA